MRARILPNPESDNRFRGVTLFAGVLITTGLAGCEYPTAAPIVETRWVVPSEDTRFGVAELLPGAVTLAPDSSAFLVDFDPVIYAETLGSLCPACAVADGLTVPKPPFIADFSETLTFPDEVYAVSIESGAVVLEVVNGLNFDPIRPSATARGEITVTITDSSDGDVLGSLVIDGNDRAFPPSTVLVETLTLSAATIDGELTATALVNSPLGDDVTMDQTLGISVTVSPVDIRVTSVDVDVSARPVSLDPVGLEVQDVDPDLADQVVVGALNLDVVNPFGVAGSFEISISGPTIATLTKSASIGPEPSSSLQVAFTGEEVRSFLGQPDVILSGGAILDPGAGIITVAPGEELVLSAELDVTLRIGG